MVANLSDADLLLILTNIGGLYTANPHRDPNAQLIPQVEVIDSDIERLAADTPGKLGTGGMITKVEAAKLATSSGVTVVIADGRETDVILRLANGEALGTRFLPATTKLESRKRWMLTGLSLKGSIVVDAGAARALRQEKRSLLPAGVRQVEGPFERGDAIAIYDSERQQIACGIASYGSSDIETIHGLRSERIEEVLGYEYGAEVVHRDNLVLL